MGRGANWGRIHTIERQPTRRRGSTSAPSRWDAEDRQLLAELTAFTTGWMYFPTRREFVAANRRDLASAVSEHGGVTFWADRLGLALRTRQDKTEYTVADAVRDARAVIAEHKQLPGVRRLRMLRHDRLATAVQNAGGARRFEQLHGLTALQAD